MRVLAVLATACALFGLVVGLCVDSPARFEPSGLSYNTKTKTLYIVSDTGEFGYIDLGTGLVHTLGNNGLDVESVTYVPSSPDLVYLGVEYPPTIIEWNIQTNQELRRFLLPGMPASSKRGMEALAFVPSDKTKQGGFFWAGTQDNGGIYVFEVPLMSNSTIFEQSATLLAVHDSYYYKDKYYYDLSDLYYSPSTGTVFGAYAAAKGVVEIFIDSRGYPDGGKSYWDLHELDIEGFAIDVGADGNTTTFLASDTNQQMYSGWFDSDGSVRVDCADNSSATPVASHHSLALILLSAFASTAILFAL
eukprot:Opistho-2@79741